MPSQEVVDFTHSEPMPALSPPPHHCSSAVPLASRLSPSCFSEAALQGWVQDLPGHSLPLGHWDSSGFCASFSISECFPELPKEILAFPQLDLWKAIKDTGKTDNPLSFDNWQWQWRVCLVCVCVRVRPLWTSWLQTPTPPLPHLSSHLAVSSPNCLLSPAQR